MEEEKAKAPVERDLKLKEKDVVRESARIQSELFFGMLKGEFQHAAETNRFTGPQALEWWGYRLNRGDCYAAVHDSPSLLDKLFEDLHWTFCADERDADNIDGLHQLCDDCFMPMSMDICEKDPKTREEFADSQWVASLMRRYERDTPPEFFARPLAPHLFCTFMPKSKTVAFSLCAVHRLREGA
jgi:hypothetical protein